MASAKFVKRVSALTARITYKPGSRLILSVDRADPDGRLYLQVEFERPDVYTGIPSTGRGGKAYLSEHMINDEIVRLAFGLFLAYETHEVREFFQVDGISIFGPHISLDALLEAGQHLDFRIEADHS